LQPAGPGEEKKSAARRKTEEGKKQQKKKGQGEPYHKMSGLTEETDARMSAHSGASKTCWEAQDENTVKA
jgi:hypothetical protein